MGTPGRLLVPWMGHLQPILRFRTCEATELFAVVILTCMPAADVRVQGAVYARGTGWTSKVHVLSRVGLFPQIPSLLLRFMLFVLGFSDYKQVRIRCAQALLKVGVLQTDLRFLVLDEADKMLGEHFLVSVQSIIEFVWTERPVLGCVSNHPSGQVGRI